MLQRWARRKERTAARAVLRRGPLHYVQADTVVRWERERFRRFWARVSRVDHRRPGRPATVIEVRRLIERMVAANPLWRAPRLHGELQMLGIQISERTVSRILRRLPRTPTQTWKTFLHNHLGQIVSIDFFTVPTVTLRVLFVFVVLEHRRRRGQLFVRPPIGLVYHTDGKLILDPDQQIQQSLRMVFDTFQRTGSALATVRTFRQEGLRFPRRIVRGPNKGDVLWGSLEHSHVLRILHNPRYAGVFIFGRSRARKTIEGDSIIEQLPREQWHTFLPGAHPGYISWEQYENNLKQLAENRQARGRDRRKSPPALHRSLHRSHPAPLRIQTAL